MFHLNGKSSLPACSTRVQLRPFEISGSSPPELWASRLRVTSGGFGRRSPLLGALMQLGNGTLSHFLYLRNKPYFYGNPNILSNVARVIAVSISKSEVPR